VNVSFPLFSVQAGQTRQPLEAYGNIEISLFVTSLLACTDSGRPDQTALVKKSPTEIAREPADLGLSLDLCGAACIDLGSGIVYRSDSPFDIS
jgi:hypothetical protein